MFQCCDELKKLQDNMPEIGYSIQELHNKLVLKLYEIFYETVI